MSHNIQYLPNNDVIAMPSPVRNDFQQQKL